MNEVTYKVKITNNFGSTDKNNRQFRIYVPASVPKHIFKRIKISTTQNSNGDVKFYVIMANDPEVVNRYKGYFPKEGIIGRWDTSAYAFSQSGKVLFSYMTIADERFKDILAKAAGEYDDVKIFASNDEILIYEIDPKNRHNFDNSKSNIKNCDMGAESLLNEVSEKTIPVIGGTMTKPDGTTEKVGPGFIGHRKDMNPIDEMADKIKETREDTFVKTAAAAANPVIKKLDTAEKLKLYQSEYDHLEDKYDILVERYGELEAKYKKLRDNMQKLVIKSVEVMTAKDDEVLCQLMENGVGSLFDVIINTSKEDE